MCNAALVSLRPVVTRVEVAIACSCLVPCLHSRLTHPCSFFCSQYSVLRMMLGLMPCALSCTQSSGGETTPELYCNVALLEHCQCFKCKMSVTNIIPDAYVAMQNTENMDSQGSGTPAITSSSGRVPMTGSR